MDTSICPVCLISVDGIGDDGDCKRWFHIECVKMSKTEYSKFANDNKKKWLCNRAGCLSSGDQPMNLQSTQMSDLLIKCLF